ncbi:MAG TPA: sugar ABC transporter ATP-binding protein [Spirochaetes bacterium]|nr:sugar ABC transporter ATP-binding protein [Spirochaetota bacterium]
MAKNEILVLENIFKSFGVVKALKDVSFSVDRGEVHAILGENGAGKSTLVKIIKGELKPDTGRLVFEGNEIKVIDPLYASSIGITMVHQELTVFENLSVAENIFPKNVFRTKLGLIDKDKIHKMSSEKLALFNLRINPAEKIANLPLAEQRIIEILRAIGLKQKLIILDEPTSGLNESEVRNLIAIVKRLKSEGISILYISHRISEVLEISDRVTVLKDGNYVSTLKTENVTEDKLIHLMVGREVDLLYSKKKIAVKGAKENYLELENVSKENFINDISFKLHKKEILGIFGLEGSGIEKLSQILFGLDSYERGRIRINNVDFSRLKTEEMLGNGFIYLNNDRKKAGLFFDMTASDNMACPVLKRFSKSSLLKYKEIHKYTEKFIKKFNIVIPGIKTKPKNLSGGNQQKLMFSICLGVAPECVIVNEPTRGVDVGAKAEIHRFILDLPENNTSVIIFSSELPELISLCDRVVVMKNKAVAGELAGSEITEEKIMVMAARSKIS